MINSISKPKIPKEYKYILRTNQIEEILAENQPIIHVDLLYNLPAEVGSMLEAFYWVPNEHVPYNRIYIRAGALLNKDVNKAREELVKTVFPEFIEWMNFYLKLPYNSPLLFKEPYFNAIFKDNKVEFINTLYK